MYFLAIESSGKNFSAALFKDGALVEEVKSAPDETASQKLLFHIVCLLEKNGVKKLDGIAVGLGPGGYTGLRVGLATAVGLSTFRDIPLFGVSTLKAMALGAGLDGLVSSVLPAGRGHVYAGFYRVTKGIPVPQMEEAVFLPDELQTFLKNQKEMIQTAPPPEASFIGRLTYQESPPPMSKNNIKIKYLQEPDFGKKGKS